MTCAARVNFLQSFVRDRANITCTQNNGLISPCSETVNNPRAVGKYEEIRKYRTYNPRAERHPVGREFRVSAIA